MRGFLQGLVTNDMQADLPIWAALLTPQGKTLFDFFLWADGEDILIDCEAAEAEALSKRLTLYRLRRKIAIAVDPSVAVYWAAAAPDRPADPRLPELGVRWLGPPDTEDVDISALYHAHRLSLGVPEGVAELGSDTTLWLETNAAELNGVSFTKGCYVGQENTARMNWRQKVNRRLVAVPIADADPARIRASYPDLGIAVELRRVETMAGLRLPPWQAAAIA